MFGECSANDNDVRSPMAHDAQQASAMHRRYSANIPEATLDVGENVFSSQDSRRMFGDIFGDASGSTYDEMYTRD